MIKSETGMFLQGHLLPQSTLLESSRKLYEEIQRLAPDPVEKLSFTFHQQTYKRKRILPQIFLFSYYSQKCFKNKEHYKNRFDQCFGIFQKECRKMN